MYYYYAVSVYLTSIARHELYYEDYQMVAVMFASLQNFVLDLANLRVLNEIITEFDKIVRALKPVQFFSANALYLCCSCIIIGRTI